MYTPDGQRRITSLKDAITSKLVFIFKGEPDARRKPGWKAETVRAWWEDSVKKKIAPPFYIVGSGGNANTGAIDLDAPLWFRTRNSCVEIHCMFCPPPS